MWFQTLSCDLMHADYFNIRRLEFPVSLLHFLPEDDWWDVPLLDLFYFNGHTADRFCLHVWWEYTRASVSLTNRRPTYSFLKRSRISNVKSAKRMLYAFLCFEHEVSMWILLDLKSAPVCKKTKRSERSRTDRTENLIGRTRWKCHYCSSALNRVVGYSLGGTVVQPLVLFRNFSSFDCTVFLPSPLHRPI